jgi:hypothetical protein
MSSLLSFVGEEMKWAVNEVHVLYSIQVGLRRTFGSGYDVVRVPTWYHDNFVYATLTHPQTIIYH